MTYLHGDREVLLFKKPLDANLYEHEPLLVLIKVLQIQHCCGSFALKRKIIQLEFSKGKSIKNIWRIRGLTLQYVIPECLL